MSKLKAWTNPKFTKKAGSFFTGKYKVLGKQRVLVLSNGKLEKTYDSHQDAKLAGWKSN